MVPVAVRMSGHGLPFDRRCKPGWSRAFSQNHRQCKLLDGAWRDTFLFTRSHDMWECVVQDGRYLVTICIGDAGFSQHVRNVTVRGQVVFDN